MKSKTDHVGSTRAMLAVRNNILQNEQQDTDYYPFGRAFQLNDLHLNRYLFGGKEYVDATVNDQPRAQLDLYDFHARHYSPFYGRWFNPDPARQSIKQVLEIGTHSQYHINGTSGIEYMFKPSIRPLIVPILK